MTTKMHNPISLYSYRLINFDADISLTQNVILTQGSTALASTINLIEKLKLLVNDGPITNAYFSPEIPNTLSNLCYQAGLASTILFNDSKRGSKESAISFKLRTDRVAYVKHWCDIQSIDTPTLKNRGIRNALTHIDEYLADALTAESNVAWYIDMAIESRNQFETPSGISTKFCRSYIKDENKILHLDKELCLKNLYIECHAGLAVVFGIDKPI